jgi:hypothetical protein
VRCSRPGPAVAAVGCLAGLNVLDGTMLGRCMARHRHQEFIRFLNAVETFFSAMTRRRLQRGVFRSLVDLQAAIHRYLAEHNADPKPFVWTATPEKIIAKLQHMNASVH